MGGIGSSANRRSSSPHASWPRPMACPPRMSSRALHEQLRAYRATLQDDRRHLLERFEIVDMARKVVGVGSVGTRAFIVLLQGRDAQDPLFLQVKEATASVLEDHLPKSRYQQPGERVVQGQRMMQAASDIFLGWTRGVDVKRHFYWRQLRDMKGSALVEAMSPLGLTFYARICGWTLARAHARSGDPVAISEYLGDDDEFDRVDHRLLRALRRSERAGLPGVREGGPVRPNRSARRRVKRLGQQRGRCPDLVHPARWRDAAPVAIGGSARQRLQELCCGRVVVVGGVPCSDGRCNGGSWSPGCPARPGDACTAWSCSSRSHPGSASCHGLAACSSRRQAIVLGPCRVLPRLTALRDRTTRWMWWFHRPPQGAGGLRLRLVWASPRWRLHRRARCSDSDRPRVEAVGDRARGNRHGPPAPGR